MDLTFVEHIGYVAAVKGLSENDNPYRKNSKSFEAWKIGYKRCRS